MELKLGEYLYIINEKTGESLPIPDGYKHEFLNDIAEIMSHVENKPDLLSDAYYYETVNISLNLTKNCNLACKYCFNHEKENKSLSYLDAIKFIELIIKSTPNAKQYVIDLAGSGEPLLEYEKILKIAEYAYNKSNEIHKHIMPQLVSNGTLLTIDKVNALQKANVLFGVSIDGKKKIHDQNRIDRGGNGTFDKIMKNVKAIKHRDFVGAAVTISNDNIDIVNTVKFLSKYFNTISVKIMRPEQNDRLNYQAINENYKELTKYILKEASKGSIKTLKTLLNGDDFFGKYIFRVFGNFRCYSRCDAGIGKFSMDYSGSIYTCSGGVGNLKLCIGNLRDGIDFDFARKLQASSFENETCKHCKYNAICSGECLVVMANNNSISTDMCKIKKNLIELALYIKAEFTYKYSSLLNELYDFLNEKGSRSLGDEELIELSKKTDKYTFMELKSLKDNKDSKYDEIKEELL